MTFSLLGRCARTGQPGAVLTQHRTAPRLGPMMLDMMQAGRTAAFTGSAEIHMPLPPKAP